MLGEGVRIWSTMQASVRLSLWLGGISLTLGTLTSMVALPVISKVMYDSYTGRIADAVALIPPKLYDSSQCYEQFCLNEYGEVTQVFADSDFSVANRTFLMWQADPELPHSKVFETSGHITNNYTGGNLVIGLENIFGSPQTATYATITVGTDGIVTALSPGQQPLTSFMGRTTPNASIEFGDVDASEVTYQLTTVGTVLDAFYATDVLVSSPNPDLYNSKVLTFSSAFTVATPPNAMDVDLRDIVNASFCAYPSNVQYSSKGLIHSCSAGPVPGDPNGLATLDADGKLVYEQVPDFLIAAINGLTFLGNWNAENNTPTLINNANCTNGTYYVVNVAGNYTLEGFSNWQVGYLVLCVRSQWSQLPITFVGFVTDFNGRRGSVHSDYGDYTSLLVSHAGGPLINTLDAAFWVSSANPGLPYAVVPSVVSGDLTLVGAQFGLETTLGAPATITRPSILTFDTKGRLTSSALTNFSSNDILYLGNSLTTILGYPFATLASSPGLPNSQVLSAGAGLSLSGATFSMPNRFPSNTSVPWNYQLLFSSEGVLISAVPDTPQASQISYGMTNVAATLDTLSSMIGYLTNTTADFPQEISALNITVQQNSLDISDIYVKLGILNATNIVQDNRLTILETNISTISAAVQNLQNTQISQASQISNLQGNVTNLQNIQNFQAIQISGIQTNISNLQSTVSQHTSALGSDFIVGTATPNLSNERVLTGTTNQVSVTLGVGTATLSTPQNIHTAATPTFAGETLNGALTFPVGATNAVLQGPSVAGVSTITRLPSAVGTAGQYLQLTNAATGDTAWANAAATGRIFTATSTQTVNNPPSTFNINPSGVGSLTVAANSLVAGNTFKFFLGGTLVSTSSTAFTLSIRYNGVTIGTISSTLLTSTYPFTVQGSLTIRSTGGAGSCLASGLFFTGYAGATSTLGTCPTNVAGTLSFQGLFGTTTGTQTMVINALTVELS